MNLRPTLALGSVTVLAVLALGAAPAHADTPGCVSKPEYQKVEVEMTMQKAHRIFDTDGRRLGIDGDEQVRNYRACGDPAGTRNVGLELVREAGTWYVAQKFRVV